MVSTVSILLTLLVIWGVTIWRSNRLPQTQLQKVLSEVGRVMYLPPGQEPALATVTNPSQLQDSIKSVAKKGDDVLVYEKQQELILYRPSSGKIVAVEPIIFGTQPNPTLTVSVAVLNGSGNSNNMQTFISSLYSMYPNLDLVYKDNAPRLFPTTIVFGQGVGDSLAEQIGKSMNVQAGQDPLGVSGNLARLTFIIGQDYNKK